MGILFWFDSRGFVDAKHYSKGLFGACANFGAEIHIFIAQKRTLGTRNFLGQIFLSIFFR
jgi:hypothetical protein